MLPPLVTFPCCHHLMSAQRVRDKGVIRPAVRPPKTRGARDASVETAGFSPQTSPWAGSSSRGDLSTRCCSARTSRARMPITPCPDLFSIIVSGPRFNSESLSPNTMETRSFSGLGKFLNTPSRHSAPSSVLRMCAGGTHRKRMVPSSTLVSSTGGSPSSVNARWSEAALSDGWLHLCQLGRGMSEGAHLARLRARLPAPHRR